MKQSRLISLIESVANVAVGFGVAVLTQILIFPIFGLHTTLAQNLKMGAIFTVVSIARSVALRRVFKAIYLKRKNNYCSATLNLATLHEVSPHSHLNPSLQLVKARGPTFMPVLLALACILPVATAVLVFFQFYLLASIEVSVAASGIVMFGLPIVIEEFKVSKKNSIFLQSFEILNTPNERWYVDWVYTIFLPFGYYLAFIFGASIAGFAIGWNTAGSTLMFSRDDFIFLAAAATYPITFTLVAIFTRLISILRPTWSFSDFFFVYVIVVGYLAFIERSQSDLFIRSMEWLEAEEWVLSAEDLAENSDILTMLAKAAVNAFMYFPALAMGSLLATSRRKKDLIFNLFDSLDPDTQSDLVNLIREDIESRRDER